MRDIAPEALALERIPFFRHLDERELDGLAGSGRRRDCDAGETIFREGDEPDGMYVVLAGAVKLVRRDPADGEMQVAVFKAGGYFGEPALLEGRARAATAVTLEPCELLLIDRTEFLARLRNAEPDVLVRALGALSRATREATERMWEQELARERLHAEMEINRHRALAQMVAGVAHELNTPLGLAHTAADMIEKRCRATVLAERVDGVPAARRVLDDVLEASGLLRRNVVRAHSLVEAFKQVSVRQLSDAVETVDAAQVVADVVSLFEVSAREAQLAVRVEDRRDCDAPRWTGSPSQLTQVLLNLLTNVERYAYPDGRGGEVEIALATVRWDSAPAVELTVRDFGRGVKAEHRRQIFEPFFTTGRGRGGTGLGMTIVHGLVTSAMGGTIAVDSEPGRGTAVKVTLPIRRPPMP
jgi:signal transduction histidine kinase